MAYYAFLDENNKVVEVIAGIDENETIEGKDPETWYSEFRGLKCIRTSFNNRIRYNFAGKNYLYDPVDDAFIPPKPCNHKELELTLDKKWICNSNKHEDRP